MKYKAFVSHSLNDKRAANYIRRKIQTIGIEAYLSERDPQPGKLLSEKIKNAILDSDVLLILFTGDGLRSTYVAQEIGFALGAGKRVVHLLFSRSPRYSHGMLTGMEYIDFRHKPKPYDELLYCLKYLQGAKDRITVVRYARNGFEETRPMFDKQMPEKEYYDMRLRYEDLLCARYYKEDLIQRNKKRYPISILLPRLYEIGNVEEQFDLDSTHRKKRYTLPQTILEWGQDRLLDFMFRNPLIGDGQRLYDGHMPRLVHHDEHDGKLILHFQETTFFEHVLTNLAMDVRLKRKGILLRDKLEPAEEGRLRLLADSWCANGFGVGCIVKTSDDKFIIARRSKKVSNAMKSFAPSAGGTMNLDYDRHGEEGPPSISKAAERHLMQEMHIRPKEIKSIKLLGITRELERGGYPDGHFYVEVTLPFSHVKAEAEAKIPEHRPEFDYCSAANADELAGYMSNKESSSALRGCIYLLNKAGLDKPA